MNLHNHRDTPVGICMMKRWRVFCFLICFCISTLTGVPSLHGASFNVNSTSDLPDLSPGNGLCVAYLIIIIPAVYSVCTLRAAVEETNALPGKDTIRLSSGTYRLAEPGVEEDLSGTGDLDITESLDIIGNGADSTFLDAGGLDRMIDIHSSEVQVTLQGVTIKNGKVSPAKSEVSGGGGGIRNEGYLVLQHSVVADNRVMGTGVGSIGGGILNSGDLRLSNSRVEANSSHEGGGLANTGMGSVYLEDSSISSNLAHRGGGIVNDGRVDIVNSTISSNSANLTPAAYGGGVYNAGILNITFSTLAENRSRIAGGLVNVSSATLHNSIVAGNSGGDCFLPKQLTSKGHNLFGDENCNHGTLLSDLVGVDPLLHPLQIDNSGTKSHFLGPGSPAIDAAQALPGIRFDQHGENRPRGVAFDIGAVESGGGFIAPLVTPLLLPALED